MTTWSRVRLDWLTTEIRQTMDPRLLGANEVFHYSIPALDILDDGAVESAAEVGSHKLLLQGGEVLVSKLNPRITRVFQAERHALPTIASTEFVALVPNRGLDHRFLQYWLVSESTRQYLHGATMSVTRSQQRVRPDILTKMWLRVPLLEKQEAIADYLDTETAGIVALIEKKQTMVRLLDERRMSVMAEGVGGLLTSPSVQASEMPWIATRGVGWQKSKLTLIARLGSGHTPSRDRPEWWIACDIPWITTGEVAQMRSDRIEFITETREKISALGVANSSATVHPVGTVVLCRTASAGYSAIMGADMATSQDFATWTCGPLLRPRFLLMCLRVMRQDLLGRLAMGSTHKTIYMPDIESLRVPLPGVEEQDRIVEAVWDRLLRFDHAVDQLQSQIALLQERRQALITAAVTGELDIPGVAA